MLKTIEYGRNYPASSDFTVEQEAIRFMQGVESTITTSSWLFVDMCRAIIAEDTDNKNTLHIIVNGTEYRCNEYARMDSFPLDLPVDDAVERILMAAYNKKVIKDR